MLPKKDRVKVAIFVPNLCGGGAEKITVTLANGLALKGCAVDLVLSKAEGVFFDQVNPLVRIVDLSASRLLFSLPSLVRYLKESQPDTILSVMAASNILAICARKFSGVKCKVVCTEHSNRSISALYATKFRDKLLPFLIKLFYRHADKIIAVSRGVEEDLYRLTNVEDGKIVVVYNPIVPHDTIEKSRAPIPEHLNNIINGDPLVISVGRLSQPKNHILLISAFSKVLDARRAKLIIVGEGEDRKKLEALIDQLKLNNHVLLTGFMDNPYPYMYHASVFVMSSLREGLPTVLVEAMACGTPVVSTDCPSGPAEILEDGKWGRLVPVGDSDALAKAILDTLGDECHPDVAARAQDFTEDKAIDAYHKLLLGLK